MTNSIRITEISSSRFGKDMWKLKVRTTLAPTNSCKVLLQIYLINPILTTLDSSSSKTNLLMPCITSSSSMVAIKPPKFPLLLLDWIRHPSNIQWCSNCLRSRISRIIISIGTRRKSWSSNTINRWWCNNNSRNRHKISNSTNNIIWTRWAQESLVFQWVVKVRTWWPQVVNLMIVMVLPVLRVQMRTPRSEMWQFLNNFKSKLYT